MDYHVKGKVFCDIVIISLWIFLPFRFSYIGNRSIWNDYEIITKIYKKMKKKNCNLWMNKCVQEIIIIPNENNNEDNNEKFKKNEDNNESCGTN